MALFAGQVDLRGQPAAGTAQPVIGGFVTGWLELVVGMMAGDGGVLMSAGNGGVDRDVKADQPAASARCCNPAQTPAQMPSRCQRRNSP